jgi:glycerol-3-phosphate acyltransferase PlsY
LLGVVLTVATDFISVAALSISITAPMGIWLLEGEIIVPLILCIATAVMIFKHIENIQRIINRTEIGLRSTAKGEKRIK